MIGRHRKSLVMVLMSVGRERHVPVVKINVVAKTVMIAVQDWWIGFHHGRPTEDLRKNLVIMRGKGFHPGKTLLIFKRDLILSLNLNRNPMSSLNRHPGKINRYRKKGNRRWLDLKQTLANGVITGITGLDRQSTPKILEPVLPIAGNNGHNLNRVIKMGDPWAHPVPVVQEHRTNKVEHPLLVAGHLLLVVGHLLLVVGHLLLAVGHQVLAVGHQVLVVGHQVLVVGHQVLVVGHPVRVVEHPVLAVEHPVRVVEHPALAVEMQPR